LIKPRNYGILSKDSPIEQLYQRQEDAVTSILNQFQDHDIVFLDAPTGSGKSLIGMMVAATLGNAPSAETLDPSPVSTLYVSMTKQLQDQLENDFECEVMKGRSNYRCDIDRTVSVSDGPCQSDKFDCDTKYVICPYYIQKKRAASASLVVTNLHFALYEGNYGGGKVSSERELWIADEGHEVESALLSFVSIVVSRSDMDDMGIDLPLGLEEKGAMGIKNWAINKLPAVSKVVAALSDEVDPHKSSSSSLRRLTKYKRLRDKLERLTEIHPAKWLVQFNDFTESYSVEPFYVDEFFESYIMKHTKKLLLMSATFLGKGLAARSLGLDPKRVGWHQMQSTFPAYNRPFNYIPLVKINRSADDDDYRKLASGIDRILERHPNEKGVVHTKSFKIRDKVLALSRHRGRFITHKRSSNWRSRRYPNREDAIEQFIGSNGNKVLISPSAELGIDLYDDLARFQVIAKVPWPYLGDTRIKIRADRDPEWYRGMAVSSIVQQYGRSTRHKDDYSTTYIIDKSFSYLVRTTSHLFPPSFKDAYGRYASIDDSPLARDSAQPKLI
jgi:Rad3-related DNA helicase